MKLIIVDALPEHGESLLTGNVRKVDIAEWVLGSGGIVLRALVAGIWEPGSLTLARAVVDEQTGQCHCLYGVTGSPDDFGAPFCWLIATDEMAEPQNGGQVTGRMWKQEVAMLHAFGGDTLKAIVYERNALHIRWLHRLGFKPLPGHSNGYQQEYIRHV